VKTYNATSCSVTDRTSVDSPKRSVIARTHADRLAFVREHTALAPVPFVSEVKMFTATEVTPLWSVTATWLASRAVAIPYWSVPWAGGQALARYVLDHPDVVREKSVIDFGAGGGLVAIAAMKAGARRVRAVDVDPLACAAIELAATANGVALEVVCADLTGSAIADDVLLGGDLWYEPAPAERFAAWMRAIARDVTVLSGDPGRAYVPADVREIARYEVPTSEALEGVATKTTRVLLFESRD
jgi:predicted nicotinamide N-methyase